MSEPPKEEPPVKLEEYIPHRVFFCEECKMWSSTTHVHKKKRSRSTSLPSNLAPDEAQNR